MPIDKNQVSAGLLGFVLGATVLGMYTAVVAPAPQRLDARAGVADSGAHPPAPPAAPPASAAPRDPSARPEEQGDSHALTFARSLGEMLERSVELEAGSDLDGFRRDNLALFCRFDRAMNAMSVAERRAMVEHLGRTRDALIGKAELEVHACALPVHTECPAP